MYVAMYTRIMVVQWCSFRLRAHPEPQDAATEAESNVGSTELDPEDEEDGATLESQSLPTWLGFR